ncbi:MAG TPA: mannose-1-phosphate guanylyltransferase [Chitinophagales bacterium]|nr:mannose-1-phosphate guanylyltransferase [Chitinophagales bacterium]
MKKHHYAVMMAGGIGSRFWPLSKTNYPKQFLDILGTGKSLLQQSYERLQHTFAADRIFIVTNASYRDITRQQLPELKDSHLLLEPTRKNTAPCIAYAAHKILAMDSNAGIAITPSDHIITNEEKFSAALNKGLKVAEKKDILITLGIRPTRPDTGYGYIQYLEEKEEDGLYKVKTFVEKPPLEMATTFYQSGDFLWNAGIFISNVRTLLNAFHHYLPEVNDIFKEGKKLYNTPAEKDFVSKAYTLCPNVSIDNAIMEKAKNVSVIPAKFGWSDLGTWASLYEAYQKDYWGNAVSGKNVMIYDSSNCMVMVPDKKLVVLEGLEDFIVVETEDVLLICRKDQEQKIKEIVMDIKMKNGEKYL